MVSFKVTLSEEAMQNALVLFTNHSRLISRMLLVRPSFGVVTIKAAVKYCEISPRLISFDRAPSLGSDSPDTCVSRGTNEEDAAKSTAGFDQTCTKVLPHTTRLSQTTYLNKHLGNISAPPAFYIVTL